MKSSSPIICLVLAAAIAVVYGQVIGFDFVDYDDPVYVTENAHVREGLTPEGLVWAFTTRHGATWQPLVWISLMLDSRIYGLDPAGFHLTNVLLHVLDTLLLFLVLQWMTRAVWPSAFVAALFALHPLHVESVAWVTSRKDVLSALFGLLSMAAYVAYTRRGGRGRFLLTAILLALGLMAKPVLVTLPPVFLLLDFWPLGRLGRGRAVVREAARASSVSRPPERSIVRLLSEKVPLLALAAISSAVTFAAQSSGGALTSTEGVPMPLRVVNAIVSYVRYMGKTLWPADLSVLYPHPNQPGGTPWAAWQVAGAGLLLVLLSLLAVRSRRQRYVAVGWLWYLGTLMPAIGLIQFGTHAMADRFTYVPLTGLFIIVAWTGADWMGRVPRHARLLRTAVGAAAFALVGACMACSWVQVRHWRNSEALFEHALQATPINPVIHSSLGNVLKSQGKMEEAIHQYRQALRIRSSDSRAHYNLGTVLQAQGKLDEAAHHYRQAVQYKPGYVKAHNNLATVLQAQGRLDEAVRHYRRALEIDPDYADAHYNLGIVLRSQDRLEEAILHHRRVLRIAPRDPDVLSSLGCALSAQEKWDEAIRHLRRALELDPRHAEAHYCLGNACTMTGNLEAGLEHLREAMRLAPDWPAPLNSLAEILATHPDSSVRSPGDAIRLAERASELTGNLDVAVLTTLATAYAAAGQFDGAIATAERALSLATAAHSDELADEIGRRLQRYRSSRP